MRFDRKVFIGCCDKISTCGNATDFAGKTSLPCGVPHMFDDSIGKNPVKRIRPKWKSAPISSNKFDGSVVRRKSVLMQIDDDYFCKARMQATKFPINPWRTAYIQQARLFAAVANMSQK